MQTLLQNPAIHLDIAAVTVSKRLHPLIHRYSCVRMPLSIPETLPPYVWLDYLPPPAIYSRIFVTGAFWQIGIVALSTLWMRYHNEMARRLAQKLPGRNDEEIYRAVRRIAIAQYQHIVYVQWLPSILGRELMAKYELDRVSGRTTYRPNRRSQVFNEFSTAAFRQVNALQLPSDCL